MTAADHPTPDDGLCDAAWAALSDTVHAVIRDHLGDCPDTGDAGLCHAIADALIDSGWHR